MTTARTLVDEWGDRARRNRVTLLHEPGRNRYIVERYVGGRARRRVFGYRDRPRAEARREAAVYGEELARQVGQRGENAGDRSVTSMTALYERYVTAVGGSWRPATHLSQRHRWRHWEAFAKPTTHPDHVDEDILDDFLAAMRRATIAPNQIRQSFACVRAVYRLGLRRGWVSATAPVTYELKLGKDERSHEPEEYSPEEYRRLVEAMDPTAASDWRCLVATLLAGAQGARINSIRHLRWEDVALDDGELAWRAEWMKQGREFAQPLTPTGRQALALAQHWRERLGYTGPWVLPAPRNPVNPVGHATLDGRLHTIEAKANVEHLPLRSFHGMRRLSATNVYERTGDILAAGEWLGDKDTKQVMKYLKRRSKRLAQAAEAAGDGTVGVYEFGAPTVPTTVPDGTPTPENPRT